MINRSITLKVLTFGLVVSLGACGGKNNPAAIPAPAPALVPGAPTSIQPTDYVGMNIVPQLQAQYGNIWITPGPGFNGGGAIVVAGVTFPAGQSITWAQAYTAVLQISARSPNCVQNVQQNTPYWAQVNYGCLWSQLNAQDMNILKTTQVSFQNIQSQMWGNNQGSGTLYLVIDMLLGSNYSYYNQTQQYQFYGTPNYAWGQTPYQYGAYNGSALYGYPQNGISAGLNFAGGNGGYGLNFGGVFNWQK